MPYKSSQRERSTPFPCGSMTVRCPHPSSTITTPIYSLPTGLTTLSVPSVPRSPKGLGQHCHRAHSPLHDLLTLCPGGRRSYRPLSGRKTGQRYAVIRPATPVRDLGCLGAPSAVLCWWVVCSCVGSSRRCIWCFRDGCPAHYRSRWGLRQSCSWGRGDLQG